MNILFAVILSCLPIASFAQESETHEMISTADVYLQERPGKGANLRTKFFLPMLDNTLESSIAREVFGIEASLEEAIPLYYKKFKKVRKEELKNITVVSLSVEECYRIIPSQVVCVKYQSAGMKTVDDISVDKYLTYDFKNKKVVQLSDMVNETVLQALKDKGLNVDDANNIRIADDSLFISVGGINLNIDVSKFYVNMTDYALGLLCRNRADYQAKTELGVVSPEKLNDLKPAAYEGGQEALMKYLAENTKFPKGHQLPMGGGMSGMGGGMPGMGGGMPGGGQRPGGGMQMNNMVLVKFVVDKDGGLYSVSIAKSIDPFFDNEALKSILGIQKFTPATSEGTPVRMQMAVPVTFRPQFGGFGFGGFGGF